MLDGALHVPPYVQLVGDVGADPDPPPLAYDTLNVFGVPQILALYVGTPSTPVRVPLALPS